MDHDTELCYLGEKSIGSANWSIDYKGMVLLSIMYLKGLVAARRCTVGLSFKKHLKTSAFQVILNRLPYSTKLRGKFSKTIKIEKD